VLAVLAALFDRLLARVRGAELQLPNEWRQRPAHRARRDAPAAAAQPCT